MENAFPETKRTTPRLVLRPFVYADAIELHRIESQSEMVCYQDFEPRTPENAATYVKDAMEGGENYVEFAVSRKGNEDELIGRVGASIEGEIAWIWFVIAPEWQGQGYAREAAAALIQHLFATRQVGAIQIECDPRNEPSCRLAESLEFNLISDTASGLPIKGEDCGSRVYRLHRLAGE